MSKLTLLSTLSMALIASHLIAQPPSPPGERRGGNANGSSESPVIRLMAYDKDQDGKLTREELNDKRLSSLFDRADADHDTFATTAELTAFFDKESQSQPGSDRGGPGGPGGMRPGGMDPSRGGPGGQGGPPEGDFGRGPGGPDGQGGPGGPGGQGGPGGFGPPRPGVVPSFVLAELQLSDAQRQDLEQLQRDVDARLSQILTPEQRQQLSQFGSRGGRPDGPPGRPRQ